MAGSKITELTEVTNPATSDVVAVVSGGATKKLQLVNLAAALSFAESQVAGLVADLGILAAAINTKAASARLISAGAGLSGGGDLSADRTLAVAFGATGSTACVGNDSRLSDARTPSAHAASHASGSSDPVTLAESQVTNLTTDLAAKAPTARSLTAGGGLTGGGDLSADRTFAVGAGTGLTVNADDVAVQYGTTAGTACQGNDGRLSDARTPSAHAASHKSGGSDAIKLDEFAAPTDVTTLNVTSALHGLAPKSPSDATKFLNGAATPAYAQVKESDLVFTDVVTSNVSTTKHGFVPKAPNDASQFLDGTGAFVSFGITDRVFAAGNYLGSGSLTWTVNSTASQADRYIRIGKWLYYWFDVGAVGSSVLGGTAANHVSIRIPGGFTSDLNIPHRSMAFANAGGATYEIVQIYVAVNSTTIDIYRLQLTNWPNSGSFFASGQVAFIVQ